MGDTVRIAMMGSFLIYINEKDVENPVSKSRKGTALMEFLVLNQGRPVPSQQLLHELWPERSVTNPENALKTLVSRMRALLNQMSPGLGSCIASDRGAYHWQVCPGVSVDVLELMELFDAAEAGGNPEAQARRYRRILELYKGDLYQTGDLEGDSGFAQQLHAQYLNAVYAFIDLLNRSGDFHEVCAVCRAALEVDSFDNRLHIELMKAMTNMNHPGEALAQYNHAADLTRRYLGAQPGPEMTAFYQEMARRRRSLKASLDAIRRDLLASGPDRGAFVCGYEMFKTAYSLQTRNLERLGATMFLAVLRIDGPEGSPHGSPPLERATDDLVEILRNNLRKGDVVTRCGPGEVALLLPTVNHRTGGTVIERIRQLFYRRHPNSDLSFSYRMGMLGKDPLKAGDDEAPEDVE